MCTTCVREFWGAFIIALDIEKIYTRVRARVISQNVFYFFRWLRKRRFFLHEKLCFIFSLRSSTYSLTALSETDNARKESQGQRRIHHTHTHTRGGVHFFSFFSLQRRYICALSEHISPKRFLFVFPQQTSACIEERALVSLLSILDNAYAK